MGKLSNSRCFSTSEWKEFYKQKTGDEFRTRSGFRELYIPERGLCQLSVTEKLVVLEQVSGDGRFWKDVADIVSRLLGLNMAGTLLTRRNPVAYMRLFGYEVEEIEEHGCEKRYYGRNKRTGLRCWLTPAEQETSRGDRIYFVTWESGGNAKNQRDSAEDSNRYS